VTDAEIAAGLRRYNKWRRGTLAEWEPGSEAGPDPAWIGHLIDAAIGALSRRDEPPMQSPAPGDVRAARMAAGHTQRQAAAAVGVAVRTWQGWEWGSSPMQPGLWRLYRGIAGLG
jgi:DNA-binding XRE family transcriptional regulator